MRRYLVPLVAAAVLVPAGPAVADTVQPGTFAGLGFDTCTAPSAATMQTWRQASPYRAVGIYFGGNNRACRQPALTAQWVADQTAAGWHLMPIYLGPQASCTTSTKRFLIDNAQAATQGRAAADDAVVQARAIGLARESVLIYDMEAYRTDDAACRAGVLAFLSAWTARLHDHGYASGFYSSMASGMADQVDAYNSPGYVRPDFVDFARWDNVATLLDPAIPATYWWPQRRMKQYRGDHVETYGGIPITIDNDLLDVAPLPPAGLGDFTGNGWTDILARTTSSGALVSFPGNGGALDTAAARTVGTGWGGMSAILRIGDLTGDGREDVVGRVAATGELMLYPGTGTGLGAGVRIGTGWTGMREITPLGDVTGDGLPDLAAVQTSTGRLLRYAGRPGPALTPGAVIGGSGWNGMSELAAGGDFDRDGRPDLIARQTSSNVLYLYPGLPGGTGFAPRRQIGTGWNIVRDLVGGGDFDRDGYPDLVVTVVATGAVMLYPGTGTGFRARRQLATSFGARTPLA